LRVALAGISVDRANYEGPDGSGLLSPATRHGTFCAGIVRQVAPACEILAIRVLDADGTGTGCSAVRALDLTRITRPPPPCSGLWTPRYTAFVHSAGRRPMSRSSYWAWPADHSRQRSRTP
jgi:hypothetical protein